jgi:hypothetical protein
MSQTLNAAIAVEQHRRAMSAVVVHGVGAGDKDWWRAHGVATGRCRNSCQIFALAI